MSLFNTAKYREIRAFLPVYMRCAKSRAYPHLYCGQLFAPLGIRFDAAKRQRLWERPIDSHPALPPVYTLGPEEPWDIRTGLLGNKTQSVLDLIDRKRPGLIKGVMDYWRGYISGDWTVDGYEEALQSERVGLNVCLGKREMKLALPEIKRYFLESWGAPTDDEPLIVYDKLPPVIIRTAFPKPWIFPEDLLNHLADDQKPTSEMLLLEPYRGGLPIKRNRWGTDMWSALTEGRKVWMCFPPSVTRDELGIGNSRHRGGQEWFYNVYQRYLLDQEGRYEFVQDAGDIVYIPHGWWYKWTALGDKNTSLAKFFIDRKNIRDVWKAMGGSVPESLLAVNEGLCTAQDPYGFDDSSTRPIDPLGLRLEVWPRWVHFLRHTAPQHSHDDLYWYPHCAPSDHFADVQNNRGYGTLLRDA